MVKNPNWQEANQLAINIISSLNTVVSIIAIIIIIIIIITIIILMKDVWFFNNYQCTYFYILHFMQ